MRICCLLACVVTTFAILSAPTVAQSNKCTYGDVRLVGGSGDFEGNVQVCINRTWGYVCDNGWTSNDARVVCEQLGYSASNYYDVTRKYDSFFGFGNGIVFLDNLYCSSSSSKLTDCNHGAIRCNPFTDIAGVICSGGNCTNREVRLIISHGRSEGYVEVCHNNQWGTVCGNSWYGKSTQVVCSQLGYGAEYSQRSTLLSFQFGYASKPIWFSNVNCLGNESSIFDCSKSIGNTEGCTHIEDVKVRCFSSDDSHCTSGDVRLWSAYDNTPANEGIIQICRNGRWYAMCGYNWDCYLFGIVCRSLGYSGAISYRNNAERYYGYYYYRDQYRYYNCHSSYSNVSQCSRTYYNCGTALGVVCSNKTGEVTVSECTNGSVRLVNGNKDNEGRVEYCYKGQWSPMCYLSTDTAMLICKILGYERNKWAIALPKTFGASSTRSMFYSLSCPQGHANMSQCSVRTKSTSSCYVPVPTTCYTDYGLKCIEPTENCKNGDVRLANGVIEQEGRPEICIDGVWSTICQWSWSNTEAYIFCKTLGYSGRNSTVHYNSYFGQGNGFAIRHFHCFGWEDNIYDCSIYEGPYTCWHESVIGVECKDKCDFGDIRLVGGEHNNEGTVEMCYNELWGQISDYGWSEEDAKVVCQYLGYVNGAPRAMLNSRYGKSKKTIHATNVQCTGNEFSLTECHKILYSLSHGKRELQTAEVAGVNCVHNEPTPPTCTTSPDVDSSHSCSSKGSVRLMKDGVQLTTEGRVEYCNGEYWTPLCTMDNRAATVVCKLLGHTQYRWGAILENGEFGILLNYSLIQNISCTGSESSISQCTVNEPRDNCLPWCPQSNIGLRCFSNTEECQVGSIRLVDGIIEQEGRVEVCLDGVWGSVCDDGWDKTDAHVVCTQMGYPNLEPYIFKNSRFGNGQYPIVYSNVSCGGWEESLSQCRLTRLPDFTCSQKNTAGVLCGYDCADGDVRLVGGPRKNEGTVEVCFSNLWGLIDEYQWSLSDAKVVCTQLGYGAEGANIGSGYDKPNKTVHLKRVQCTGSEETIRDCNQETYSLEEGKNMLGRVNVAGVKCYVPNGCVSPPSGGSACDNGDVRLLGESSDEGALEYCHKGFWSPFCSLNETEATVACRQLGHYESNFVSIFTDGRFNSKNSYISYFEHLKCSEKEANSLEQCSIIDGCQSTCQNPIGIKCYKPQTCNDGDIRLEDGRISQEGRIEVCYNNIWGSVCGEGFDFVDAYVACKAFGISEPVVYTNSHFGDGDGPIVYSNLDCKGYEDNLNECDKNKYGNFSCSREKVVGIKCQKGCTEGSIRLVGGQRETEGVVEVCYDDLWGLIAASNWDNNDASVVCSQLGYQRNGAVSSTDPHYDRPNGTIRLGSVSCTGLESNIGECEAEHISEEIGKELYKYIEVARVSCLLRAVPSPTSNTTVSTPMNDELPVVRASAQNQGSNSTLIALGFVIALFGVAITIIIGLVVIIGIVCTRKKEKKSPSVHISNPAVAMSSINDPVESDVDS